MIQAVLQLNTRKMVSQIVGNDLKTPTKFHPSDQVGYSMSCYETIVNGFDQIIAAAQAANGGAQQIPSMNMNK